VVAGHVIQAGAPSVEGRSGPGYTIPNEIHADLSHARAGILGMANGGPHTNGSQFYITLGDRSYLDGDYTVFGEVWAGMEVVEAIEQGDVIQNVLIIRIGKSAKSFRTDDEAFQALVSETRTKVEEEAAEKARWERMFIHSHFPDAVATDTGWKYVVVDPGQGALPKEGDILRVLYTGQKITGEKFYSSSEDGKPQAQAPAQLFLFTVGESHINPGVDEALRTMKKGEERTLILTAEHAYGTDGFYAKEIPGQKRFVISPHTTLRYDIKVTEIN
jgi:peptidylprolyl isomerase